MQRVKVDRTLNRMAISAAIGEVEESLGAMRAQRKSAIKTQLEFEEALLAYADRYGDDCRFGVSCLRRFGKIFVRVAVEGQPFNPVEEINESTALLARLVAMEDYSPRWDWQNGINTIEFPVESEIQPVSLTKMMLGGFAVALVAGFASLLLPEGLRTTLVGWADPAFGLLLEMIKGIAGPFIFISIVCSVCAVGDVSVFGRRGIRMLLALLGLFLFADIAGVVAARLFTTPGDATAAVGGVGGLSAFLVKLVPVNLVAPFVEGNIPQILILAVLFGVTLLALETRVATAVKVCEELKTLLSEILNLAIRYLLPPMVFLCIFAMVASGRMSMILSSWKIAALTVGTVFCYTAAAFGFTCARFRVSPRQLFAEVFPSALIGFTTSSPLAGLSQETQTLKRKFGVNPDFADFSTSLALPISSFGYYTELAVMMVAMAGYYGMAMPSEWLLSAVVLVAVAGLSTPPFPGTSGIVMGLLLTQLGIPAECVGLLIAIDMGVDYFSCFGNAILRLCLIRNVAPRLGEKKK